MVYYHENCEAKPEFPLPLYIEEELEGKYSSSAAGIDGTREHFAKWTKHVKFDIGFVRLTPTDWVEKGGVDGGRGSSFEIYLCIHIYVSESILTHTHTTIKSI
jgi:hypothetical protein